MAHDFNERGLAVQSIISHAGGKLVGRTRLQKVAYLLEVLDCGFGFDFAYKHYGPFSESLSTATLFARSSQLISEDEQIANWGGRYSVFQAIGCNQEESLDAEASRQREIVKLANEADAVELEIAATAILLFQEGFTEPWIETKKRKPAKVTEQVLTGAKSIIASLREFDPNDRLAPFPC